MLLESGYDERTLADELGLDHKSVQRHENVAKKYDTSKRRWPGCPPAVPGIARLVVRLAKENPLWDIAGSTASS